MLIEHEGRRPHVHETAWIAPTAVLAGDVTVGPESCILHGAVLTAEAGSIEIGRRCIIMEQAVVRALVRKGWGIAEANGTRARIFYARVKQGQLYKAEILLEPSRIVIRYRPGFGSRDELSYLEGIRFGLMNELALY